MPARIATRTAVALSSLALVVAPLTACGSDEATADLSANGTWAQGICEGFDGLVSALNALGQPLPSSDASIRDRVTAAADEVSDRVTAVKTAADDLTTAIKDVPPGADTAVSDAQASLEQAANDVRDSLAAASTAVDAAKNSPDATTLSALASAASELATTAQTTSDDIRAAVASGKGTVEAAFQEAPACDAYTG